MSVADPQLGRGSDDVAVGDARELLREQVAQGIDCPCCGQFARVYWRRLNASMARFVVLLYRAGRAGTPWVDIRTIDVRGGDYAKAELWKLCESQPNTNPAKRTSGMWRLTPLGVHFAEGKTRVPTHTAVYNGKPCGTRGDLVNIHETLDRGGFNYRELMNA